MPKNICSLWFKFKFLLFVSECKSTIPCWLSRLAFLLSGCELPVMSACASCKAVASCAESDTTTIL